MAKVQINQQEFNNLLDENRNSTAELAKILSTAKAELSKLEYKAFIEESGLSKDQVSRLLKRAVLLTVGFSEDMVGGLSDSKVLKLTNKQVETVEELQLARKEMAKGEIDWGDFVELYDSYRIIKTDAEKFTTKVDGVVKALGKFELDDECLTKNANKLKEFVKEWSLENTKEEEELA